MLPSHIYPLLMVELERAHRNDLLKEAERHRLLKKIKPTRPGVLDRLLVDVGRLLIAAGQSLQKPYASPRPRRCQAHPCEC